MTDVQVSDHPEVERYEIRVDGRRAGLAAYELEGDVITFTHTEIDDAYEGQGLGSRLADRLRPGQAGRGRVAHSHQSPRIGSTSGTNP